MQLSKRGGDATKIYPMQVFRPYRFTPCGGRAECKTGEVCRCTALDRSPQFDKNICINANICRPVSTLNAFCKAHEQCANCESCFSKTKATEGKNAGSCRKNCSADSDCPKYSICRQNLMGNASSKVCVPTR
jgi:hypothetical protein